MKIRKAEILNFLLVIALFAVASWLYPQLPERVASHWDINGSVNGYVGRFWGAFLVPVMCIGLLAIFFFAVRIDPRKQNIEKSLVSFDRFVTAILAFMFYVYALTIAWSFGRRFDMGQFMAPGFAILLFAAAALINNSEPNWTIGIRTPWTLSSDVVWRKTQKLGARLLVAAGAFAILGFFFPAFAFWLLILPVIAAAIVSLAYSYFIYARSGKPPLNPKR